MQTELKEKIFYTAKNDKVFKTILGNEDNKELLRKFLERILDKKIEDITYLKNELTINYPEEKRKTVDLLVKTRNEYIHIELNNGYSNYLHMRNFCYLSNLYSRKTKVGKKYNIKEKFIQINFTYKNIIRNKDKKELRKYYVMDEDKIKFIDNFEIWEYNMDRIMQIWYDNDELEIEKYKHLIMLDSNSKELEKLSKGDELVKEFKEEIEELNENETYTSWLTPEEDAEFILNTEKSISFEEGKEVGLLEGQKAKQIEIAKALLENNVDLNVVVNSTGLSIEEINKLQN